MACSRSIGSFSCAELFLDGFRSLVVVFRPPPTTCRTSIIVRVIAMAAAGEKPRERPRWLRKRVQGVLLDITGVLYDSGESGGEAIAGSVNAVKRLLDAGYKVRFCTNESQCTRVQLTHKLNKLGYSLQPRDLFAPAPAARAIVEQRGLRPWFLVHPDVLPEFDGINCQDPNCVIIGDAAAEFSYENMNQAFRIIMEQSPPVLISMGIGKYYMHNGQLNLDVGAFAKALEYACGIEAEPVGKPAKAFFLSALKDMKVDPEEAIMIGDDIQFDVGGAQAAGIRGIQVRTGKFRPQDEHHPTVTADGVVTNLAEAVDLLLQHNTL